MMMRKFFTLMTLGLLLGACGSDDDNGEDPGRDAGDDSGRPGFDSGTAEDGGGGTDGGTPGDDADLADAGIDGGVVDDVADDTTVTPDIDVPDIDPACDQDRDGFLNEGCGGNDCDDDNARINPGARDVCDFEDNNCNGELNEDQDCSVFAHTADELYRVDPFGGDIELLSDELPSPSILDFDTTLDGELYGITNDNLLRYNTSTGDWDVAGSLGDTPGQANGFAINSSDVGFITAGSQVLRVDLETGRATLIGSMGRAPNGNDYESSGDCVINKDDSLFMTSRHTSDRDTLVIIEPDGTTTERGMTNHDNIFGLTAAYGYMFGFTVDGQVIEIDELTGESRLLHTFSGRRWFGAASSPAR